MKYVGRYCLTHSQDLILTYASFFLFFNNIQYEQNALSNDS